MTAHWLLGNTTARSHPLPVCPQITAVCNFFTYIRYIQQGLVRQDGERPLVARGGMAPGRGRAGSCPRIISPRVLLSSSEARTLRGGRFGVSKGLASLLVLQ